MWGMKKYAVEIILLSIAVLCILLLGVVKLSGDGKGANHNPGYDTDSGEWSGATKNEGEEYYGGGQISSERNSAEE